MSLMWLNIMKPLKANLSDKGLMLKRRTVTRLAPMMDKSWCKLVMTLPCLSIVVFYLLNPNLNSAKVSKLVLGFRTRSLADPAGRQGRAPLLVQFLSFSCRFQQKSCQTMGFCQKFMCWRPLWKILDLPLLDYELSAQSKEGLLIMDSLNLV